MKHLKLADWKLGATFGKMSGGLPRYLISDVQMGVSARSLGYGRHIADTDGSLIAGMDEWRFEKMSKRLNSLIWQVPDMLIHSTLSTPSKIPAEITLLELGGDIGGAEYRDFSQERLLCLENESAEVDLCLEFAPDLCLLFCEGRWCGWLLENPIDHLPGGPGPAELAPCVAEYYQLVSDDTLDDLFDQDPALLKSLQALHARTKQIDHPSATFVADFIAEQIDRFYNVHLST